MSFGNINEAMAFEKSGWSLVDISADGSVIYMGKASVDEAEVNDPVWCIKRIKTSRGKDGSQLIETRYAYPLYRQSWFEKENIKEENWKY